MARLLIYLLLGICIIAFISNVKADDHKDDDDDDDDDNDDDDDEDEDDEDDRGIARKTNITRKFIKITRKIKTSIKSGKACISGEMRVNEQTRGLVRVSELSEGDVIYGITGVERKPAWCKVVAVFPSAGGKNMTTHDGFTADHMVIDHTVHPYGKNGEVGMGPVYTLATDCDASVNAAGQAFSPISTAFCPHELSWSEYITLMSSIRRVANHTGYFWFDTSAYHDNETAMVPHWIDRLHQICHHLLLCSREGRCQGFENVMAEFVHEHLNQEYVEVVVRVFPNMGGDVNKAQAGTITGVVRPDGSSHLVLFSTLGSAMVMLLIVAVAVLLYHGQKMKKAEKKLPFQSDASHP